MSKCTQYWRYFLGVSLAESWLNLRLQGKALLMRSLKKAAAIFSSPLLKDFFLLYVDELHFHKDIFSAVLTV
jgi:hypothetical protein